ncbi:T3SS effector HopA1 family protein [Streptomyces sp. NPDC001880]
MTVPVIGRMLHDSGFLEGLAGEEEAVGREIYHRFHLAVSFDAESTDDHTLVPVVREELGDRTRQSDGWTCRSTLPDGRLIVRRADGLEVAVGFDDIERMHAGRIVVRMPSLEPGVMKGWVCFHGSTPPLDEAEVTARIYLCLDKAERARSWSALVAGLDDQGHVFSSKIIRRGEERKRPDSAVVYCRPQDVSDLVGSLRKLIPPDQLGEPTAGFAVRLSPGISVSVPQESEDKDGSLGMHRSLRIARALLAGASAQSAITEVAHLLARQDAQVSDMLREVR